MYTEKVSRKFLENWDIEENLPIVDIYIMNGAKVFGKAWAAGNDYILKSGSREKIMMKI